MKAFRKQYGATKVGEVTVDMVSGSAMRRHSTTKRNVMRVSIDFNGMIEP